MTSVSNHATKHFVVGDHIIGIAAAIKDRQGQIIEVLNSTGSKQFRVKWSNGEVEVCFVRGIQHRDQPSYFRGPKLVYPAVLLPQDSAAARSYDTNMDGIALNREDDDDEENFQG